jgi:hypothetical protein
VFVKFVLERKHRRCLALWGLEMYLYRSLRSYTERYSIKEGGERKYVGDSAWNTVENHKKSSDG